MSKKNVPAIPRTIARPLTDETVDEFVAMTHYDAITNDRSEIVALANMLEAIFDADQPADGDASWSGINLELAGPGLAVVARCINAKVRDMADRAKELVGADAPSKAGAR